MSTEPYASADRVFWMVDNGSSHRGAAAAERMTTAWPNAPADPPARACLLAGPRNLLLGRPAQGPHPQRLHRPGSDPRPPRRVRDPLQRHRPAVHLEVHPRRTRRPATADRRARQDSAPRPGSLTTMDPDELTGQTTEPRRAGSPVFLPALQRFAGDAGVAGLRAVRGVAAAGHQPGGGRIGFGVVSEPSPGPLRA
jgi:hypothetical protein